MVTLSGLGYGSIFPLNPYVRLVASFENIGIFYLAVVVSRLVSSYHARVRLADAELDKEIAERIASDPLEEKTGKK